MLTRFLMHAALALFQVECLAAKQEAARLRAALAEAQNTIQHLQQTIARVRVSIWLQYGLNTSGLEPQLLMGPESSTVAVTATCTATGMKGTLCCKVALVQPQLPCYPKVWQTFGLDWHQAQRLCLADAHLLSLQLAKSLPRTTLCPRKSQEAWNKQCFVSLYLCYFIAGASRKQTLPSRFGTLFDSR